MPAQHRSCPLGQVLHPSLWLAHSPPPPIGFQNPRRKKLTKSWTVCSLEFKTIFYRASFCVLRRRCELSWELFGDRCIGAWFPSQSSQSIFYVNFGLINQKRRTSKYSTFDKLKKTPFILLPLVLLRFRYCNFKLCVGNLWLVRAHRASKLQQSY